MSNRPLIPQHHAFLRAIDDQPYEVLHSEHQAGVRTWCRVKGYAEQSEDGKWSLTTKGALALATACVQP
jgi:hypothetical protein